jgi:antitoxin component of MazEF toxin-antitoxin module
MNARTRKVDVRGRVTLFPDFAGELVVVERVSDDEVWVRKAKPVSRKYTLAQLLAGVTPENIHAEVDTGSSVGGEAW